MFSVIAFATLLLLIAAIGLPSAVVVPALGQLGPLTSRHRRDVLRYE